MRNGSPTRQPAPRRGSSTHLSYRNSRLLHHRVASRTCWSTSSGSTSSPGRRRPTSPRRAGSARRRRQDRWRHASHPEQATRTARRRRSRRGRRRGCRPAGRRRRRRPNRRGPAPRTGDGARVEGRLVDDLEEPLPVGRRREELGARGHVDGAGEVVAASAGSGSSTGTLQSTSPSASTTPTRRKRSPTKVCVMATATTAGLADPAPPTSSVPSWGTSLAAAVDDHGGAGGVVVGDRQRARRWRGTASPSNTLEAVDRRRCPRARRRRRPTGTTAGRAPGGTSSAQSLVADVDAADDVVGGVVRVGLEHADRLAEVLEVGVDDADHRCGGRRGRCG